MWFGNGEWCDESDLDVGGGNDLVLCVSFGVCLV